MASLSYDRASRLPHQDSWVSPDSDVPGFICDSKNSFMTKNAFGSSKAKYNYLLADVDVKAS